MPPPEAPPPSSLRSTLIFETRTPKRSTRNTDVGAGVGRVGPLDDREPKMWHSVHVRGVASSISESTLARVFAGCGRVIDCRLSGEGRSRFRFAFVAFASEGEVEQALGLDGLVLEGSKIRVQRARRRSSR